MEEHSLVEGKSHHVVTSIGSAAPRCRAPGGPRRRGPDGRHPGRGRGQQRGGHELEEDLEEEPQAARRPALLHRGAVATRRTPPRPRTPPAAAARGARVRPTPRPTPSCSYYKKTETDAKFLAKPSVTRGMYSAQFYGSAAGQWGGTTINFPVALSAGPTTHFIASGGVVPAGCTGSATAPGAAPGHLCIFERYVLNRTFANAYSSSGFPALTGRESRSASPPPGLAPSSRPAPGRWG